MPFKLIKGRFHPKAGRPDGDSVRFLANDLNLWQDLRRRVVLGTGTRTRDTVQLRFEGIDSIEKAAIEPLATQSRDNMLDVIGFDRDTNPEPRGFVLSRMADTHGRPISFLFLGGTSRKDGSDVFLDETMLRDSVNFRQLRDGFAYPLYYNTLFASLREELTVALADARSHNRGYWPTDGTGEGVRVQRKEDLDDIPPIWPKIWRRLEKYLRNQTGLSKFVRFLEDGNERVDILSTMEEQGMHDLVKVQGNRVWLTEPPENIRVRSSASP